MEPRLAELSRSIDQIELGRRLRRARIGAGLTQAQVVGDDVTTAYLSRIESGHRRPEAVLLERMADRIGVSLASLLDDAVDDGYQALRLALDHAELKLASGDLAGSLADLDHLEAELVRWPALSRAGMYVRARALEAIGDYNEAIILLEDLTAETSGDAAWLKGAMALCRCYRQAGDTSAAIAAGERASDTARDLGLEGTTEAIQLSVTVAWAYATAGDNDRALRMCLRALQVADRCGSSEVARGSAYWNASIIQGRRGNVSAALDFSAKALAIFEQADDTRALAGLRAEVADLQLTMDPPRPDVALQILDQAEREMDWSATTRSDRASMLVTRARAHLLAGDTISARRDLDRASAMVPQAAAFVQAYAASLAGQVAMAEGRISDARAHYADGARILTGAGADRRIERLWLELGDLLAQAGDNEAAVQAFRAGAIAGGLIPAGRLVAAVPPTVTSSSSSRPHPSA